MEETPGGTTNESKYWCNFCGLVTTDEQTYLSHSCTEELRRKDQLPSPDVRENNCR